MLVWYFRISLRATVPGLYLRFFPWGTGSPAAVPGSLAWIGIYIYIYMYV